MPTRNSAADLLPAGNPESKEIFRRTIEKTLDAILRALPENNTKAYSGPTPGELKKIIHVENLLPEQGLGFDGVLKSAEEKILPNMLRTASTSYMAHLHSPPTTESVAAELILSTFNQSMDSWDQSPAATETELDVVRFFLKLYGFGAESDGTFTSGGSQSNQYGINLARDRFCIDRLHHDIRKHGLPADFRKFRIYTSCISHFSVAKTAVLLGLGSDCVVPVPVDAAQKMDLAALAHAVESDLAAGNLPFCVIATIGTTDYGSIDPLPGIRELCRKHSMWLHADAAYGSGVILSEKYADRIRGLNECDSVTVDLHKMFLMPISGSIFLLKDAKNFETFTVHADYLNREEDEEDGYTNLVGKSLQTTRRFDALKVWMAFQARGRRGWSDIITRCIDNAAYLYEKLSADSRFCTVTRPEISSVVFRLNASDDVNRSVRRNLLHKKGVVIGQTVYDGKVHLKFTLLNPLVTEEHLDSILAEILRMGGF